MRYKVRHELHLLHILKFPNVIRHRESVKRITFFSSKFKRCLSTRTTTNAKLNVVNFALIGPPGSGKGTYGSILADNLNCHLVTVGDVLRRQVELHTDIGKMIGDCQRQGKLVQDDVVSHALNNYLETLNLNQSTWNDSGDVSRRRRRVGFILDGYPRTLEQAKSLLIQSNPIMDDQDSNCRLSSASSSSSWPESFRINFGVSIHVPDDICLQKMMGRRHCPKCQIGFNVTDIRTSDGFVMPPKLPIPYPCTSCDMDKKDWIRREDDTEEIIVRRIEEYHLKTAPVINYYRDKGALLRFVPYKGIQDTPLLEKLIRDKL